MIVHVFTNESWNQVAYPGIFHAFKFVVSFTILKMNIYFGLRFGLLTLNNTYLILRLCVGFKGLLA